MSLESDIAKLLRAPPVDRINFKVANIAVNKTQMEFVAKAIESGDIGVVTSTSSAQFGPFYSSFTSRKFADGEKKLIGRMTLVGERVMLSPVGKAAVFHESVHALMDVRKLVVPSMQDDEVVAYLADAMYLRATSAKPSGGDKEMAIFNAAFAMVDGRHMLKKHVVLKLSDCDALREAIKAHPDYR